MRDRRDGNEPMVVRLSDLVGRRVESVDHHELGRLEDLVLGAHEARPGARTLVVRARRGAVRLIPVTDLVDVTSDAVRTAGAGFASPGSIDLADDEILVGRDVLDTQVYDVAGQRIARVSDVELDVAPGRVEVLAVDTGFGSVCRRLGLHRLAHRLGGRVVAWPELHLTSARGHLVQLSAPRAVIHLMTDEELAGLLDRVTTAHGVDILSSLAPDRAAATLTATGHDLAPRLVGAMPAPDAGAVLDELPTAHAAHVREVLGARARRPRRRYRRHPRRRAVLRVRPTSAPE